VSTLALSHVYNPVRRVDGPWLARLISGGAHWVCAHREELNRINVFPVVDGDTGTNMAATLRAVARSIAGVKEASLGEVSRAAAEGCLMGARGNSGMILCHIFSALSAGIGEQLEIEPRDLVLILRAAAAELYKTLETPVEGTILTVLRESTQPTSLETCREIGELVAALCREARASLERTPEKLEVLARAGVVDAGALGYVYFLEGMARAIQGLPLPNLGEEIIVEGGRAKVHEETPHYRYCTEVVIESKGPLTTGRLKNLFRSKGDSLIPLLTGRLAKIHIHTNEPDEIFQLAGTIGSVVKTKVEDMRSQSHSMFSDEAVGADTGVAIRTRIVTDSTCDLPSEVLSQWGIQLVPLKVVFGDEMMRDRVDILPDEYLHRLTTSTVNPATSQPAPEDFSQAIRRVTPLLGDDHAVLVMVLSSKLSGTYNSAKLAIQRHEENRIVLYDGGFASAPFGLLVLKAAELARRGLTVDEIVKELDEFKQRTNILFVLDTLEYMKRGGRISWGQAFLGGLLDLKPILEFKDGKLVARSKARGRTKAKEKVLEYLKQEIPTDRPVRFMLVHSGRPDLMAPFEEFLGKNFQVSEIYSCAAGAVISTHTGPGAWGIAWMVE
jgi:DegV family protein with EDD domain